MLCTANSFLKHTLPSLIQFILSLAKGFQSQISYYHRVIEPSEAECSNEYMASSAYRSNRVIAPSQIYSLDRLRLFGHLLRHPDSLEYQSAFMPSGAYRFTFGPNRTGRPRLHWSESCMVESSNRIDDVLSDVLPSHSDIHSSYFDIPNASSVRAARADAGQSLVWMDNTLLYRKVKNHASNRAHWSKLLHKPLRA